MVRMATADDADALTRLINAAFQVEAFFKVGERTTRAEVLELMRSGEFLMLEEGGLLTGCIYLTGLGEGAGYFGMLSIDPSQQGRGFGPKLIEAVEARGREHGWRRMEIHIVNLREELPPFYRRLGYVEAGTLPFSHPDQATRPCHFVVMSKPLQ